MEDLELLYIWEYTVEGALNLQEKTLPYSHLHDQPLSVQCLRWQRVANSMLIMRMSKLMLSYCKVYQSQVENTLSKNEFY